MSETERGEAATATDATLKVRTERVALVERVVRRLGSPNWRADVVRIVEALAEEGALADMAATPVRYVEAPIAEVLTVIAALSVPLALPGGGAGEIARLGDTAAVNLLAELQRRRLLVMTAASPG